MRASLLKSFELSVMKMTALSIPVETLSWSEIKEVDDTESCKCIWEMFRLNIDTASSKESVRRFESRSISKFLKDGLTISTPKLLTCNESKLNIGRIRLPSISSARLPLTDANVLFLLVARSAML